MIIRNHPIAPEGESATKVRGKCGNAPFEVRQRYGTKLKSRRDLIKSRRDLLKSRRDSLKSCRDYIIFK